MNGFDSEWGLRLLEEVLNETLSNETSNSNTTADDDGVVLHEAEALRNTAMVYGSILLVVGLVFCWLRLKFPRPFSVRKWTTNKDLKSKLADDQFGFFSWAWMLNTFTDDEILDHCGMDALCFLRTLSMGYKLCLMGVFNSIWLFPLYATAHTSEETAIINDRVVEVTVSHVPAESPRLVGTVIAAYLLFGYCMYLIFHEFEWFTEKRHKFLGAAKPRNYTVYVHNIPEASQTNEGLETVFSESFAENAVLEARLRIKAGNLAQKVKQREECLFNLETAIELESNGQAGAAEKAQVFATELKELNKDITSRIDAIEAKRANRERSRRMRITKSAAFNDSRSVSSHCHNGIERQDPSNHVSEFEKSENGTNQSAAGDVVLVQARGSHKNSVFAGSRKVVSVGSSVVASGASVATSLAKKSIDQGGKFAQSAVAGTLKQGASLVNTAVLLVHGMEDGAPRSAGFLTFKTLSTTNAALQMVHNATPFQMQVKPGPDPEDIFWTNVGRSHHDLQVGKLLSFGATAAVCLGWTVPTAFFSSLSSVEGLKQQFGWVEDAIDVFPALEPILQQLAPFLVVAFNALLPYILQAFSMLEGPVSGSIVEASTFSKLAFFMIVQTFFVSALSGGLMEEIKAIVDDPLSTIDLLAKTLPAQSTFFMQIAFVGTVLFLAMENLRVVPLALALIRKYIGPQGTEKQRQRSYFGIRPLADPLDFEHAANMAQITVLYFMIILVYQTIAPLTSYMLGFCFGIMRPAFLHQFVYIYRTRPDSGGVIWASFIKILMACMLIAQFTISGLLGLKKAGIATPLMIPLIIATMLFNKYMRLEHFRVAEFLPSNECVRIDKANRDEFDLSFLKGKYLQEELREKQILPDYLSDERLAALGLAPSKPEAAFDEEIGVLHSKGSTELSNVEESAHEDDEGLPDSAGKHKWSLFPFRH